MRHLADLCDESGGSARSRGVRKWMIHVQVMVDQVLLEERGDFHTEVDGDRDELREQHGVGEEERPEYREKKGRRT